MSNDQDRSIAAYLWLFGWLALGAGLLFRGLPQSGGSVAQTAHASATTDEKQPLTAPIEQIQVGQRVAAYNPTGEEDLQFGREVDPATWKRLTLKAPKKDGTFADVVLLRPEKWLADHDARVDGTVEISVPECGIEGFADVLAIDPCPTIHPGSGKVVTGMYRHESAHVLNIQIAGQDEPIGTTSNHPFWSEDKQKFVRADQLQPGDQVRTLKGVTRITSITPRDGPQPVYNLEVAVAHTYHVGDVGVLVHNGGATILCAQPQDFFKPGFIRAGAEARIPARPSQLHEFSPPLSQPGRSPGHVRSKHGWEVTDPRVVDIRNNPDKIYVGTNKNGNEVVVFWKKDGHVAISDANDTTALITAHGPTAPKEAGFVRDKWASDERFFLISD